MLVQFCFAVKCAADDSWSDETLRLLQWRLLGARIISDGYPKCVINVISPYSREQVESALRFAMGSGNGVTITEFDPTEDSEEVKPSISVINPDAQLFSIVKEDIE